MKSCRDKAVEWGVSERTVNHLCQTGRIDGAFKEGGVWKIPDEAGKPADSRVSSSKYVKRDPADVKKPLPIGLSEYVRAQSEYYYVDKTRLIKEFLDSKPLVSLFTRPRRFGKTLNMDMLRVFFEISDEDTSVYFRDKEIWKYGESYTKHQGRYPVIFLSFKDVKFDTWNATVTKLSSVLQAEFERHSELRHSERLSSFERSYYELILRGTKDKVLLSASLENLSRMLSAHYGVDPVIIIDEYDTPIQEGYSRDYYNEIITFMRVFFSSAFKDNKHLTYGFLTGILRISQESIFSGLNNLTVNSVFDREFDDCFGFTESEVQKMMEYYGCLNRYNELKEWYDGYLFGDEEIYNPWSVINYIAKGCVPQAYWANTGRNEILEDVLRNATDDIIERLHKLMDGDTIVARINQNVIYRSLSEEPENIYSLLLVAGYLTATRKDLMADGSYMCEVALPNKEIAAVYKSEILSVMMKTGAIGRTTADRIAESMYSADTVGLQAAVKGYLTDSISYYDSGTEGFYHGLLLGLIALMDDHYMIKSNRESGEGRYDICMFPRERRYPGIIMELKWKRDLDPDSLEKLAQGALDQITDRKYETEMTCYGVSEICRFGVAFSGKDVRIKIG